MILAEIKSGKPDRHTLDLLGGARQLADAFGEPLGAVLLGSGVREQAQALIAAGADRVLSVDDPLLGDYQNDACLAALQAVVGAHRPQLLLFGHTPVGRDLAPRLAFRLEVGLAPDCVAIEPGQQGACRFVRPVFGGMCSAAYVLSGRPQIATVRPMAMSAREPDPSRRGEVTDVAVALDGGSLRARFVERVKAAAEGVRLEDADVVVSGGRGLGSAESFSYVEELAEVLGGVVGASKAACDEGWISPDRQVGLTGKVVGASLYVAVGISGASQHMAGCSGAKCLIAVNTDAEAPIFKHAHYGVVGDYKKVLPPLIKKLRELKSQ
ncbi:MAG: electron transfer flavoprotein subunit alpha/FixB family protein [Candidatus Tectomicrobia bacterium]|nr:electron transfer flavoprotein subunit alpha/FixB family protein [Candidatus Tectomicrobia bacterium]